MSKKNLSPKQIEELLKTLKALFEKNKNRHKSMFIFSLTIINSPLK